VERTVDVYYVVHRDGLSRLSPVILRLGDDVWNGAIKRKSNGVNKYYLFTDSIYVKLWKDGEHNLLYSVDNYGTGIFFDEELQVREIVLTDLNWNDRTLTYKDTKIKFTVPIFRVLKQIYTWLPTPVAYLLFDMFIRNTDWDSYQG